MNFQESYRDFVNYIKFNIITQRDGDTGDSAQRLGVFICLTKLAGIETDFKGRPIKEFYENGIRGIEKSPGLYRRSPDPEHWGYKTDNFTRDQRGMLELGMACMEDTKRLKESGLYLLKRGGFHQNTRKGTDDVENKWKIPDFTTPGEITTFFRGLIKSTFGKILMQPILNFLDLGLIFDVLSRGTSHDIDNMLATKILYDNAVNPTIVSRLAMKLYLKMDFMQRIKDYHSIGKDNYGNQLNGIGPFPDLFKYAYQKQGWLK